MFTYYYESFFVTEIYGNINHNYMMFNCTNNLSKFTVKNRKNLAFERKLKRMDRNSGVSNNSQASFLEFMMF